MYNSFLKPRKDIAYLSCFQEKPVIKITYRTVSTPNKSGRQTFHYYNLQMNRYMRKSRDTLHMTTSLAIVSELRCFREKLS